MNRTVNVFHQKNNDVLSHGNKNKSHRSSVSPKKQ